MTTNDPPVPASLVPISDSRLGAWFGYCAPSDTQSVWRQRCAGVLSDILATVHDQGPLFQLIITDTGVVVRSAPLSDASSPRTASKTQDAEAQIDQLWLTRTALVKRPGESDDQARPAFHCDGLNWKFGTLAFAQSQALNFAQQSGTPAPDVAIVEPNPVYAEAALSYSGDDYRLYLKPGDWLVAQTNSYWVDRWPGTTFSMEWVVVSEARS